MNLLQLEEGLKTGSITVDSKYHRTEDILESLTNYLDNERDWIKELEAGNYVDHEKKVWDKTECDKMVTFLNSRLNRQREAGQYLNEVKIHCWDCSCDLLLLVVDESNVSLISYGSFEKQREDRGFEWLDFSFRFDTTQIPECPARPLKEAKKLTSEISVPSGELLFCNFFKKDELYEIPKDVKYKTEHSINGLVGRNNLMQYLATQNIGYGQMGNMGVDVFVNKAGDEIIISTDYGYNSKTDREFKVRYKGFKPIGRISLSVWRWMCGDLQVLREHQEPVPDGLVTNGHIEDDYKDYVLAKVKTGTWVIEHYYDMSEEDDLLYSKLYLKKS